MRWIKKGHIFNPNGELKWSKEYAQIPRALILKDRVRVFYATRYYDQENAPISQTSFVDLDRNDLSNILHIHNKPSLKLGGSNSFSEYGIHPTMLFPHNNSIYFFYQGWQRGKEYPYTTEIGIATSKNDGLTFSKKGEEAILKRTKHDPIFLNGVFILEKNQKFNMWYSSGKKWIKNNGKYESVYLIKNAKSNDLINWEFNNEFCIETKLENECQNSATVIYLNNKYHMWFCYRPALDFRNSSRGYRIGYAFSHDMKEWKRDDSKAGIDISQDESWDSQMICYPYVFTLDNKIIMLYCGNYFGKSGFGYAELIKN